MVDNVDMGQVVAELRQLLRPKEIDETGKMKTEPNIILAPSQQPVCEGVLNIGTETIIMPSEADQRAGWYEPQAFLLALQYPKTYKSPTQMGQQPVLRRGPETGGA